MANGDQCRGRHHSAKTQEPYNTNDDGEAGGKTASELCGLVVSLLAFWCSIRHLFRYLFILGIPIF